MSESQVDHFAKGINIYKVMLLMFIGSFAGVIIEMLWCLVTRGYIASRAGLVCLVHNPKTSYGETEYLARCPEEWNTTDEQEDVWVNRLRSSPDTLGITCYASNI